MRRWMIDELNEKFTLRKLGWINEFNIRYMNVVETFVDILYQLFV